MEFNSGVPTYGGLNIVARSHVDNSPIKFTRIVTGDGEHAEGEDLALCEALLSPRQSFPIAAKEVVNNATIFLKAILTNHRIDTAAMQPGESADLEAGYWIREVGVYIEDPDNPGEEILYSIAIAKVADWMPAYNGHFAADITLQYLVEVASAANVVIVAQSDAYALAEDLDALRAEMDALELTAHAVSYDPSGTGIPAENAQDAIDYTATNVASLEVNVMATQAALTLLQTASIAGLSDNVVIEPFLTGNDVQLLAGVYDNEHHRLYA